MKTTNWICDTCGQLIEQPNHGWVEWLSADTEDGKRRAYGLRLVHHAPFGPRATHSSCQYAGNAEYGRSKASIGDMPLTQYLGPDGLMELLAFLYDKHFADQNEVLEMIKRLHIPGYEHAFRNFDAAIADSVFEPNTAPGFYSQHDINAVLEWAEKERRNA